MEEEVNENEKSKNRIYKVVKENKTAVATQEIEEEKLTKELNHLRSSRGRGHSTDFDHQSSALEDKIQQLSLTNRDLRTKID